MDENPNNNNNQEENKEFDSKQFYLIVIATVTVLMLASTVNNLLIKNESKLKAAVGQIKDQSLVFFKKKAEDGGNMYVVSNNVLEACIWLKSVNRNTTSELSSPSVLDVQLSPSEPVKLNHYSIIDKEKDWHYDYQTKWLPGNRGGTPDLEHIYLLPFEKGIEAKISEKPKGKISHNPEMDSYSIDFSLPKGTQVLSARAGKIIAIRTNSNQNGNKKEYGPAANYIVIKHNDGSYANYFHLKHESEKVELGATVEAGEPIALSGNTGWSTKPHLHFAVFKVVESEEGIINKCVPIKFNTNNGVMENLVVGKSYSHPQ